MGFTNLKSNSGGTNKVQKIARDRTISNRKDKKPKNTRKSKESNIRGKEVTIRESASPAQVVYGLMKIGGVVSYIDTSLDSNAYVISGESANDNELLWTSKFPGAYGNDLSVEIICTGTHPTLDVSVIGDFLIRVRVKSNSGASQSTMNEVITAVRANFDANYRIAVRKINQTGVNGFVDAFPQTQLSYGGGSTLYQYITLAGHRIINVEKLFLNNEEVTLGASPDPRWATGKYANKVFMAIAFGYADQEVQPDLYNQKPNTWTENHRQRGCAGVALFLNWNQNLFPEGYPEITFLVKGKDIYDPRLGGIGTPKIYSNNAALVICDFLTTSVYEGGYGLSYFNINEAALIAAANTCDEDVPLAGGGTEKRYTINGVYDTDSDRDSILSQMLAACGGDLVYESGAYYLYVAKYTTPTITLTTENLRQGFTVKTHISRSDSFNSIRGSFVSPEENYTETDYPEVTNSTYVSEDGGSKIYEDASYNFVTSASQAQRLSKIELERVRQGVTLVFPADISGLKVHCNDFVKLQIPEIGYNNKEFEVIESNFILEENNLIGVDLILRETASGVYNWNSGEETTIDLSPNTDLPDPYVVPAPENVTLQSGTNQLYIRNDGTVQPRILINWTTPQNPYVTFGGKFEIQYKKSSDSDYQQASIITSGLTSYYISDVQDAIHYDVRIKSINTIDVSSPWVTILNHTVIGKTQPPSDLTVFNIDKYDFGLIFSWSDISDLDKSEYEIRYGASWNAGILVTRLKGKTFTWEYAPAGNFQFRIKAIDTSGNYSSNDLVRSLTIQAPQAPTISSQLVNDRALLSWNDCKTDFSIKEYEIRYGASFESGNFVAVITALNYEIKVNWGGARTFYIKAKDVAGNLSSSGAATINILNPNSPSNYALTTVNNTVLLDWDEPITTSLPIEKYLLYKGNTFIGSEFIGTVAGTFQTYSERSTGTFTYWLVAQDTAGNLSTEISQTIEVVAPSDFFILADQELSAFLNSSSLALIGGGSNAPFEDDKTFWAPVTNQTQNIFDWFTANSWTTVQDAITAGFNQWSTPGSTTSGFTEYKIDYLGVFSSSYIELTYDVVSMVGTVNFTVDISYSLDDITYTTITNSSSIFATNFRYVKYKINFTATSTNALSRVNNIKAKLSLKIEEESGSANAVSTDSGGTTVTFVKTFLDVTEIQVTPIGTTAQYAVVNFVDIPNPTFFKVLLFNSSGTRISGSFFYRVLGAINP